MANTQEPKLVVSIDFGTYASGFALQLRSDYKGNRREIYCHKFDEGNYISYKTVTCLLLGPDKSFKSFGHDAEEMFSEIADDENHPEKLSEHYFFRHFKMNLYRIKDVSEQAQIEDVNGKLLPMVDVFTPAIEYIKNTAIKYIEDSGYPYIEHSTKWVLTVPAIWDESAKQVMRSCAEKAGINGKNLSIALEPECAGLYCKQLSEDQLTMSKDGTMKNLSRTGSSFMVVDVGGGTDDITTLQVNENGTMKQICKSDGGDWGGQKVDRKFYEFIEKSLGWENWSEFICKNREAELELRRAFELAKRQFGKSVTGRSQDFKVSIPSPLMDFLRRSEDESIQKILVEDGNKYFRISKSRFIFEIKRIEKIFDETIDGIIGDIRNIITMNGDMAIEAILLVGGFAESEYVVKKVRNAMVEYGIPVLRPLNPELAVLKGAVLFGHDEGIITSRVMRYTYGIGIVMEFDKKRNNPSKKFTDGNNVAWAADVFRKHVTINEEVETGKWIACKKYSPEYPEQTKTTVYVYSSTKPDPDHTTDIGCKYVGHFEIEFKSKNAEVEISMLFSGTEITIRAKDQKSGNVSYHNLEREDRAK